jgi:3-oxoacyl-[acyl-carrier-protein] synthase III
MAVAIRGTGSYLPERVVDNDEIERLSLDFDNERARCSLDDWVTSRIGIRSRHRAAPGEGSAQMAIEASRAALEDSGLTGRDLDLIVMSTFTSDHRLPQSVSYVQRELGSEAKCIQLEAACAGFVDGLAVAVSLMETMGYRNVLVVHSEVLSAVQDTRQFLMQAIFADGAGAVVLQKCHNDGQGILSIEMFTDGANCEWLRAGGGTLSPPTPETLEDGTHFLAIDTAAIFPYAIEKMSSSLCSSVEKAGRSLDDVDWVIAHQTGINIARGVADAVGIDVDRFLMTLEHTGNTSGGTIPIALDHFNRLGILADGDCIVLPAVGAGMAWGAVCCTWVETSAGRLARSRLRTPDFDFVDPAPSFSIRAPDRTGELIGQ